MRHIFFHGFGWACDFGMDRAGHEPEDIHVQDWYELPQGQKEALKPEMCELCVAIRAKEDSERSN
jgi:hypothetical protein